MCFSIFGKNPRGSHFELISKSKNFSQKKLEFINENDHLYENMSKKMSYFKILKAFIFNKNEKKPNFFIPQKNEINLFLNSKDDISYIWIGHSTVLLKFYEKTIIFDPIFYNILPFNFFKKRFQKVCIDLNELKKVDYIFISHDHYDHLNLKSIKQIKEKYNPFFVTPLGISSHLLFWGIKKDKILEMDWWQEIILDGMKIICTPSMHSSGRSLIQRKTLWASWTILKNDKRIFFSGDSGYCNHFKKIGEKYGPFDIGFIENGQYSKFWPQNHMLPTQSIQCAIDLGLKIIQPIHFGVFDLSLHHWNEPIIKLLKLSKEKNVKLYHPMMGQNVNLSENKEFSIWW